MRKKKYMKNYKLSFLPTRSRQDIRENAKASTSAHWIRIIIGVPGQGEIWWTQCWRHKRNIDVSFIAQFATYQDIWPKDDPILQSSNSDDIAMPRRILIILLWKFNLVFEPHVQRYWSPALFDYYFWGLALIAFVYFAFLDRSYLSTKKKRKKGRAGGRCVDQYMSTPCQNFKSKFVKLMGAWPMWRLNIILAGPARM